MQHPLEAKYGLSAVELLEALDRRFRAKVTLEGAVAEVQMEHKIRGLVGTAVAKYQVHDQDGHPDFSIRLPKRPKPVLAECKNVRDTHEAYRAGGRVVAYKVETQKTRASKTDPGSRYYGTDQFEILGVCLGKKTGSWSDFVFARVIDLQHHTRFAGKLAVMQRVPMPELGVTAPWYLNLGDLLAAM